MAEKGTWRKEKNLKTWKFGPIRDLNSSKCRGKEKQGGFRPFWKLSEGLVKRYREVGAKARIYSEKKAEREKFGGGIWNHWWKRGNCKMGGRIKMSKGKKRGNIKRSLSWHVAVNKAWDGSERKSHCQWFRRMDIKEKSQRRNQVMNSKPAQGSNQALPSAAKKGANRKQTCGDVSSLLQNHQKLMKGRKTKSVHGGEWEKLGKRKGGVAGSCAVKSKKGGLGGGKRGESQFETRALNKLL